MGFEGKNLPKSIQEAIKVVDTEHLSSAGRKGAEISNQKQAEKRIREDVLATAAEIKKLEEETLLRESTNENIISSDGEDLVENN